VELPHEPMRLAVRREAFTHPDWIFEIKYDGFRSLARVDRNRAEFGNTLCLHPFRGLWGNCRHLPGRLPRLQVRERWGRIS
jgi:hypothetical protein